MAYGHKTEHRLRVRAQILLHAARGRSRSRIAHETGLHLDTVPARRGRFARGGLPAPDDRKRPGRPATANAPGAPPVSPPCRSPGPRRRRVSCPPKPACHCRAGPARSRPPK
ncbi:helix-turn-helix domain-containing protein [Streptomyces sp. NPDC054813]